MPANVQTMAYVGEVPWHGLGKLVPSGVHACEMMTAAGLDWQIEKRRARGAKSIRVDAEGRERYSRYEIVRLPKSNTADEEIVLGIVTDRYEPLQNHEAFGFFDPIVDQNTARFETAGALGEGERVWVMAKMPDAIRVVRGDECGKYLLLSNTHTGQGAVIVKFTAVRVVCQNTLMLAMEDGQPAFRVRHSKAMGNRLQEIGNLIAAANDVFAKAEELFRRLAEIQLTAALLQSYLEQVFARSDAQQRNHDRPAKWDHVQRLLDESPDLQIQGVRGTLWAAFNAVTRFEDYRVVEEETDDGRLNRVWFGSGADLKLKALLAAQEMAQRN
jgi:phage/plasmid-like protein (TIGR03299 family)